ncbi:hypothetical protein NQ317_019398 [Molorchus minor]|uniref:Ig-like domain-containing protein n=1 Tax=Molorchus minor TaxID=1323400 RepID=A0ABQ9JBW2_9CUCU|nr:hypothetical protein NQ317_019398 [Molorchus minor]
MSLNILVSLTKPSKLLTGDLDIEACSEPNPCSNKVHGVHSSSSPQLRQVGSFVSPFCVGASVGGSGQYLLCRRYWLQWPDDCPGLQAAPQSVLEIAKKGSDPISPSSKFCRARESAAPMNFLSLFQPDYYRDAAHFHRVGDGPEYRLEIPNAKLDFTGTYTVYAKNEHGDAKAIISLQIKVRDPLMPGKIPNRKKIGNVQTIPKITMDLCDIRCCDGDAATLECKVEATTPPEIRWEKGGKLIHLGGDFNADFDGETARLSINQVYPEDEGEYTCVAYNELGKAVTSACLIVDIPEEKENLLRQELLRPPCLRDGSTPISTPRTTPNRSVSPRPRPKEYTSSDTIRRMRAAPPKFYAYPHNKIAQEGETVRFQCAIAGHPEPWVTWEKDGKIINSSARLTISEKEDLRILEIRDVTPSDAGVYKIVLENDVGRVEASAKLDVVGHRLAPRSSIRARSLSPRTAPTYSRNLIGASARLGGRARLYCDIRAVPTPFLRWYKDGVPLEDSEKHKTLYDGKVAALEIENVDAKDSGLYSCIAKNKNGSAETGLPKKVSVVEGNPVTLRIETIGSQPFDVVWMKDGCILPECFDFQQSVANGTMKLHIPDAYAQDSGNYRCEIYNVFGDAFSTCHLIAHVLMNLDCLSLAIALAVTRILVSSNSDVSGIYFGILLSFPQCLLFSNDAYVMLNCSAAVDTLLRCVIMGAL